MKRTLTRTVTVLAAVLAMVLVSAMSASAAGPPKTVGFSSNEIGELLNVAWARGSINPNGSQTSYYMEYGPNKEAMERSTAPVGVGEGTANVPVSNELIGINPNTKFYYQVVATNSFGTAKSGFLEANTARWLSACGTCGERNWSFPEVYKSNGTFTFKQAAIPKMTITCTEHGYGTIGNKNGIGDEYVLELNSCAVEGNPSCKVSFGSPAMRLKPNFESVSSVELKLEMSGCTVEPLTESFLTKPFQLAMGKEEVGLVSQPITLTQQTKFGANAVTITDTSEWSLAGFASGRKFAWTI